MHDPTQLRGPRGLDWEELAISITDDVLTVLRADEAFMSSTTTRAQCCHACRILRSNTPPCFHELCEIHRVVPCYFPPHNSNQLQPLDLSLFGITKRLLSRVNKLDAVNIQTRHIASVVCAFLAAAVPWNVVKTFKISGICLVADNGVLRCSVRPGMAKQLNQPLPSAVPEMADRGSDDSDVEELEVFVEECAGLLYDLGEESPE
jgi:hypothetical protein